MKHFIFTLFCAFVLMVSIQAQDSLALDHRKEITKEILRNQFGNLPSNVFYSFDSRVEGQKGSPFLMEEWTPGTLVLADSTWIRDSVQFKFDLQKNEVWARAFGNEKILFNRQLNSILLSPKNGLKWQFKQFQDKNLAAERFYLVLSEGKKFTLINDLRKELIRADFKDNGITQTGTPYDRFEERSTYWIRANNKPFQKIVLKKSALADLCSPEHKSKLEEYCKQQNLSGKLTEEQAIRLIDFMNRL